MPQPTLIASLVSLCLLGAATLHADNRPEDCIRDDACISCIGAATDENTTSCAEGHIISFGPEIYYLKRKRTGATKQDGTRTGSTKQDGTIYGIRATYDHIKRYKLYWGFRALYGEGVIHGKTGNDSKIRSRWIDEQVEGNFGYTFQAKNSYQFSFTPFAGYGYFCETNKFNPPSPLKVKFTTSAAYVSYGFLSSVNIWSCWSLGLNVRLKSLLDPKCKVNDSSNDEKYKLIVGNKGSHIGNLDHDYHLELGIIQYRIELPIIYGEPLILNLVELGIVPFYETRCFGKHENHPYDFLKTTVRIFGANLQLIYRF